MKNATQNPTDQPRRQITVTWKRPKDIEKWEETARLLGYPDACDCIRELAEEARVIRLAKLEASTTSPLAGAAA